MSEELGGSILIIFCGTLIGIDVIVFTIFLCL